MSDATHDLAEHYADLLNLFTGAGIDFPEEELSRIDDDLSRTDWTVENVDGRWEPIHGGDSANLAIHHAHKGGVMIADRLYRSPPFAGNHIARRLDKGGIDPKSIRAVTQRFAFVQHDEADQAAILRHAGAMLGCHGDLALHRIEELATTLRGVLDATPDDAAAPIKKQLSLYHRMLDKVVLSWTPYHGRGGGHGWKSTTTGEVRYQKERPSAHEEPSSERQPQLLPPETATITLTPDQVASVVAQAPHAGRQVEQMANATIAVDDDGALAEHYADLFNLFESANLEVPREELERVHHELEQTDWQLHQDDSGLWYAEDASAAEFAVHRAPKGGIKIFGKDFRGGQFVPAADFAKATPEEKAAIESSGKSRQKNLAGRDVSHAKLQDKLAEHKEGELDQYDMRSAKTAFNGLMRHHGELTLHRIDELVDLTRESLAKLKADRPDEEGIRNQFENRLRAYRHMTQWAHERGITGEVAPPAQESEPLLPEVVEHKSPIVAYRQMLLDTMRPVVGDKAEEAAKAVGLNLDSWMLANALHKQGISVDDAAKMVPGIQEKIIKNLEAEGIPIPAKIQKMAKSMTDEEREKLNKEEQEQWKRERTEKVARAKEFAARHYKKPPAPEEVDSQTWIAIRMNQERDALTKDKAKIMSLAEKIEAVERSFGENPNYYEEIQAAHDEAAKPGNKRLLNKYRPGWYDKKKSVGAKDAAHEVANRLANVEYHASMEYISTYSDIAVKAVTEHKEAVQKAVVDASRDLQDSVVEEFLYEPWIPKKYQERTITKGQIERHAEYMKDQHAYGYAILQKTMDAAEPQLKPLMDRAAENDARIASAVSKIQVQADVVQKNCDKARDAYDAFSKPFKVAGTIATYEIPEDKVAELDALRDVFHKATDERWELQEELREAKKVEGAKFLDGLLPSKGNANIEFQGGSHLDDVGKANLAKAKEFLSRAVSDKWGKMPVTIEKNTSSRACQGGGRIYCDPNESTSVIVHEYGHLIEEQHASTLGTLSKAFAMQALEDSKENPSHMGSGYEPAEIGAKDGFRTAYTGKFYGHNSSEVLSMGVQWLYSDAANFYKESPKHFAYTLAALHGLLTH